MSDENEMIGNLSEKIQLINYFGRYPYQLSRRIY